MSADLVSSETCLLGLEIGISHWVFMFSSLCVLAFLVSLCAQIFSSYVDTHQIGLGPTLRASFYFNNLLKSPISKYSHILRHQSIGLQHMNFEETLYYSSL